MLQNVISQYEDYLPEGLPSLTNPQTALPVIAKNARLIADIEDVVRTIPTQHDLYVGGRARDASTARVGAFGVDFAALLDAKSISGC